jgi:hypothetical protein
MSEHVIACSAPYHDWSPLAAEYPHLPFATAFFEPLEMFGETSQAAHLVSWSVQFVLILINSILHHLLVCQIGRDHRSEDCQTQQKHEDDYWPLPGRREIESQKPDTGVTA